MTILAKDIMSQTSIAAYRLFCFTVPTEKVSLAIYFFSIAENNYISLFFP